MLKLKFWLQLSLINLLIVALLGLVMRYKIGFEFPFLIKNIFNTGTRILPSLHGSLKPCMC